jgi:colanic acid biosynthesis glycosyl transferase WcaI
MKILLISAFFPPEVGSAAHLFYDLGQALRAQGHEVIVLTGLPRYHVLDNPERYRHHPIVWETYHGLRVLRVFNLDVPWNIPVLRGLDQFVSAVFAAVAGTCLPSFDGAIVYSPPLPLALAALGLCRIRRRPLIVNIQDLFPQSAIDLGVLRNPLLIRIFKGLESFLYRGGDLITVHSTGNRQHVFNMGGNSHKVTVIPNWIDIEAITPSSRQNKLRSDLGLNDHFIVSFAGIMGYSQDLETIMQCAHRLKAYKNIAFLLVGDGVEQPTLLKMAKDNDLDNVYFLPMQPKEKYPEVLNASDLCLVTLRKEVLTPVVPSKILSIMAAGRPVLASLPLEGDAPRLISEAKAGICIPPGDPEAMAETILQLCQNDRLRSEMGTNGRRYAVEQFSLESCAKRIETLISNLI